MLTTHPVEMPADEALWLNVEGEAVSVAAVEADGSEMAQGCLGAERSQTVYRRVCWEGAPPVGTVSLRVTLADGARLYSLCC